MLNDNLSKIHFMFSISSLEWEFNFGVNIVSLNIINKQQSQNSQLEVFRAGRRNL